MPTPIHTLEYWKNIEEQFKTLWHYPNCIGAINGKHIVIERPSNTGSMYFNYKKEFNIVLLALVNAEYRFITVDIGAYGKNSDGGIFRASKLGQGIINKKLNIPPEKELFGVNFKLPHVIVSDGAFPLLENCMRPFPCIQVNGDESKKMYNYRL